MTNDNNNSPRECSEQKQTLAQTLLHNLPQFTGTEGYTRYWMGLTFLTDGVKYLADTANCYWLLDAIASYQSELDKHADPRLHEMQIWKLEVHADESASLICRADADIPPAVAQEIEWTDFPLPEIQIWVAVQDGQRVALLPSEY